MQRIHLKIKRQDNPDGLTYLEEFKVPYEPGMNVIAALMAIRSEPVTAEGLPTVPVVWEQNCLEEVCGSCTMVINGKVRQACSALVDELDQPIVLEPLGKFPVVRDLSVDRSSMFDSLNKIKAWSELDGLHDVTPVPHREPTQVGSLLNLSSCIMCGACMEACPQVNERSSFEGAFLASKALSMNIVGQGAAVTRDRLDAMKGPGGIGGCSNAQVCEQVCPKDIPLNDVLARIQWDVTKHSVLKFLRG